MLNFYQICLKTLHPPLSYGLQNANICILLKTIVFYEKLIFLSDKGIEINILIRLIPFFYPLQKNIQTRRIWVFP